MDSHTSGPAERPHVAIAVGDPGQRNYLERCLKSFYQFVCYQGVTQAIDGCRASMPLVILVSEKLGAKSGFDLVRVFRLDRKLATIAIVMLVATDDRLTRDGVAQCGADGFLAGSFSQTALFASVSGLVNRGVERQWKTLRPLQRQALNDTLHLFNGISNIIGEGKPIPYHTISHACEPLVEVVGEDDFRAVLQGVRNHDNYTYAHSIRVATYLSLFGHHLGLPKDERVVLACGGLLHDVGKMSIPHEVLNKPGELTKAERVIIEGHVAASIAYMKLCRDLPKGVLTIAAQHHEKLDGSGYPLGLAGSKLNKLARMASIIDVFTSLTDRRAYKPPIEPEAALNIMVDNMASQLDIKLLGLFRQMLLDATRELPVDPARSA